jgi:hypothetical protein
MEHRSICQASLDRPNDSVAAYFSVIGTSQLFTEALILRPIGYDALAILLAAVIFVIS